MSKPRVQLDPVVALDLPALPALKRTAHGAYVFDYEEVEMLAATGLSQKDIAESLAINQSTVEHKLRTDSEFKAAYERGRARLRRGISGGLSEQAFVKKNLVAQIYLSKVHLGWRDTDKAVNVNADPAEIAKAIRSQLKALESDV